MIADAVADGNAPTLGESDLLVGYNKVISIRDDILSNKPPLKAFNQSATIADAQSITGSLPLYPLDGSISEAPNGTSRLAQTNSTAFVQPSDLQVPKTRSPQFKPKSPNAQKLPTSSSGSSGIDPIFLTKSDVLVRAEIYQKRQRLERALEEQLHKVQRQKASEPEALPDFDVTEVLRKAQELVKPIKLPDSSHVNGAASSSDSFDDNTFYSSQMDESTTTEEADESRKRRPFKICSFFLRGERCKYGDKCIFSHDPASKQKLEAGKSQAVDHDRVNADEQTSSRKNNASNKRARTDATQPKPPGNEADAYIIPALPQEDRERKERIARLEAELRRAKAEEQGLPTVVSRLGLEERPRLPQRSAYSPPGPDEFGRDAGLREPESRRAAAVSQRPAATLVREYGRRNEKPPSPVPSDVRIVMSHIRSPVAPQPSRVSPLAVAKLPQVSQVQREHDKNRRPSRASDAEYVSAGQSPNVGSQSRSSRKRRRGLDSGEQMRNVVPRTDFGSPVVRVKEEPVSPPIFNTTNPETRQAHPRQEGPRRVYVDTAVPYARDQEPFHQQPRPIERTAYDHMNDGRAPHTPLIRRIVSRNGQRYVADEEQDLRRVVTAPRQARAPISPALYPAQYSAPQPRATRDASKVYDSPIPHNVLHQYRASVQPQAPILAQIDRSPSPMHRMPPSPLERRPIVMAPPPRRIVVDQWGNRFMEAPMPVERHVSVAPIACGNDYDPRYEHVASRHPSVVRQSQVIRVDDEGHQYVRKVPSPVSPGYVELPTRQLNDPKSEIYDDRPYVVRNDGPRPTDYAETYSAARYEELEAPDARIVRMQSVRPVERVYDDGHAPNERIVRMQSVRPVERQYEAPREQTMRVQSVRPEQPRIVRLGEAQEPRREGVRHVSVHPGAEHVRQMGHAAERYEYVPVEQSGGYPVNKYPYQPPVQGRGYVNGIHDDSVLYEAPVSGGKRATQRM